MPDTLSFSRASLTSSILFGRTMVLINCIAVLPLTALE
jgi:hypothetical protein